MTDLVVKLTEWFDRLDFDRENEATRRSEYSEMLEILAHNPKITHSGEALAFQLEAVIDRLDGQAYSSTLSALNQFKADLARPGLAQAAGWRCFHCGEVFTDPKAAANHFGVDHIGDETLCQMAQVDGGIAKVIADLAEELQRYRSEDNTSYREFYALGADHRAALIKEEQKGYDRGLADARAEAALAAAPQAQESAVEKFKKRIVEMMQAGCTGFHFTSGAKWHSMTIEEKCAAMLEVWDASDSRPNRQQPEVRGDLHDGERD